MNEYRDRFIRFALAVEKLEKAIQTVKSAYMASLGLRGGHVMCLCQMKKHPAGLTAAELARLSEVDRAFISRTVGELAESGLVMSAGEGRRAKLVLTEKGMQLAERMDGMLAEAVGRATEGISQEEMETFYRVLFRLDANLMGSRPLKAVN